MTELCKIAERYLSDKCPAISHYYTPAYHSILKDLKLSTTVLVEIGIGTPSVMHSIKHYKPGASLRMWRDYFPNAIIIGCDIDKSVLFNNEERITTFYLDQSDETSLEYFSNNNVKPIKSYADIILDDGSHIESHQKLSFNKLWPLVRPHGGIYIIEDIYTTKLNTFATLPQEYGLLDAEVLYIHRDSRDLQGFIAFRKT